MPDSAVAQWNAVVRAWRDGEPAFRARAAAARARVAVLLAVRR
jgi:hypothetical protein